MAFVKPCLGTCKKILLKNEYISFLENVVALWEFKSKLPIAILLSLVAKLLKDSSPGDSLG